MMMQDVLGLGMILVLSTIFVVVIVIGERAQEDESWPPIVIALWFIVPVSCLIAIAYLIWFT